MRDESTQLPLPLPAAEEWRLIDGYEGSYEVSSLGRVRRVKATRPGGNPAKVGHILTSAPDTHGYPLVCLTYAANRARTVKVHLLVARAFLGPCPEGLEVNHKDGVKANAALSNLEYVTRSENMRHAVHAGLHVAPHGEANVDAVLTDEAVMELRRLGWSGQVSWAELGRRYGVTTTTAHQAGTGKTWTHLPMPPAAEHVPRSERGERHVSAKLTEMQVRTILTRAANGERVTHLAREYGVGHPAILKIVNGDAWKHITKR